MNLYAGSVRRISRLRQSPRSWVLLANAANRGVAFATSLLISRIAGPHALGEYSIVVATASSAIQPFLLMTTNNSTLLAHEVNSDGGTSPRNIAFASLLLSAGLSSLSLVIYFLLQFVALHTETSKDSPVWLATFAAVSFVIGQLFGSVLLGCYYGLARFAESARLSIVASLLTAALAAPAIALYGLIGGYITLAIASVLSPLLLAYVLFREKQSTDRIELIDKEALKRVVIQFRASLPTMARAVVGTVSLWLCTVYLVRGAFGSEGVGLIAVAMQWQGFVMLAASSSNGLSLKILADAVNTRNPTFVRSATLHLIKRNLSLTLVSSILVVLAADWIAKVYGLTHTNVALLLRLNCGYAVLMSCIEIIALLLLCVKRQMAWFLFSAVSLMVQIGITAAFITTGLSVVIYASMAGAAVLLLFCTIAYDRLVSQSLNIVG